MRRNTYEPRVQSQPAQFHSFLLSLVITATFAFPSNAATETQPTQLHQQIQKVYSFQPHLLNKEQISQKSATLDEFWSRAKAQPAATTPNLRRELQDFTNPPFFLYDGSMLLLSLSDSHVDREVVLAAIAHCDLADIQANEYFLQVHRLSALNENTTAAALHILDQPDFKVFIPQHALTLGQDYALVYLLLPTDENFWIATAIARLQQEKNETAQKSLLLLLWYAQRDVTDKLIASFAADKTKPQTTQDYARELLNRKNSIGAIQRAQALFTNEVSLRQKRRDRLKAVSDEALLDLDDYTASIMAKRR